MKILMMPTWFVNNHEKVIGIMHKELYMELAKRCETVVFVTSDNEVKENECKKQVEDGLLTYRICPKQKKFKKIDAIFQKIRKDFSPDLIHGHAVVGAGRYATYLGRKYHIPVIISEHSAIESFWDNYKLRFWANYTYRFCTGITCVSEDLAGKLKKKFPKLTFHVIYNGIAIPDRKLVCKKQEERKEIHICLVAALYDKEIKGIQNLMPAVSRLKEKGITVILHIVGAGTYLEYFKQMAVEYQIQEQCIFHGDKNREETYAIMASVDFLVSASMIESFGCSIAEELMLGKPVLVTDSGGPESFVNDLCGMIVPKGDSNSLELGIREMIEKLEQFDAEKIHEYAFGKFNLPLIAGQYIDLYKKTIDHYRK